jgi:hypothetical protein
MRETAMLRAAHVQTPQHQQWEETVLSTLPCHTPLTLSAKGVEEKEDEEVAQQVKKQEQQAQEMQQPSSHSIITNTPIKAKDMESEEDPDNTYITPRRLPFDSARQAAPPSVLRSSLLKAAAAAAAAACYQPSSSSSPPLSPPRPLRPRSDTSSFVTATMQSSSLTSSPKAPRRLPFLSSSFSFLSLSDDG